MSALTDTLGTTVKDELDRSNHLATILDDEDYDQQEVNQTPATDNDPWNVDLEGQDNEHANRYQEQTPKSSMNMLNKGERHTTTVTAYKD